MKLSSMSLLDAEDVALTAASPDTALALDWSRSVLDLFDAQVALHAEELACADQHRQLSYAQLDQHANRLAHCLIERGLRPQERVALWFGRSPDFLIALLGVLKASGCYVPLDPHYPTTYIQQILDDAQPRLLLCGKDIDGQLIQVPLIQVPLLRLDDAAIARQPHTPLPHALHPAQLAYVMYTSGSTGRPKGVMVPHRQILNWLHALWARAPFEAGERVAQKTSIAFAISVKELLAGLLAGVPQVFIDEDTVRDIPAFVRALETWQITRLYTFPSQLNALLDHVAETPQRLARLRQLFVSIEPCPAELLQRLRTLLPACTAWYIYGCTEINDMTYCDPAEQHSGSGFVPVGRPIANTKVHVLDEQLRPLPPGIMGEVHIESLGIAHGYWRQGGLTAARFIANPYGPPGSRLYRTGDMARLLDNGTLELLGRRDYEVKVRGYRVDLRQVEKALAAHLQVAEAAVIGWPQGSPTPELLAYVVPRQGVLNLDELRKLLQERLPTYMLPTRFQSLPALPRLPNGKLDTLSLPEPQAASGDSDYLAPRSEVEITLAKLWSELLTPAQAAPLRVSLNDNFFNLGGHSLLATQLFSRIRQSFDIEVRVNTLFESPVLEDFARVVNEARQQQAPTGGNTISSRAVRDAPVPLSYQQERLWFVHEHMPEQRTSYNVAFACHLRSADFSMSALREAIQALVARHETLRTRIATCAGGDYPSQHIADAMQVPVPCITATPAEVPRLVAEHAAHVFDLAHGPLLKVSVLRVSDDYHVFLMNMHHIICDGWSINLIFHDLRAFYIAALQQTPPALPPLLLQYADYATWQRVQDFSADLDYWKQRLHGYEEGLALPYDFPRPTNRAWRAGILHLTYPDALAARLAAFSQERRVTLFMTLMASLAIVLHQYTGRRELCLGTTSAGRDQLETENLIGFFVNILAVRLNLGSHAFAEDFLQHVRQQVLDAYAHRALPFEHVLSALKKPRDSSQIPLVPVMLRHQNFATEGVNAFAQIFLSAQMEFGERTTPNELDLQFIGDGSHLEVTVEYAAELFSAATVQRMLTHHQRVLERMLEEPRCHLSDFSLPVARTEVTPHTLDTSRSVLDLFDAQVALHAEELACADQHRQLSYAQLDQHANRLAHCLIERGLRPQERVALWFGRSPDFLIALLGVLKAGGCYVPLDPHYPTTYIQQILDDAQPRLLLCGKDIDGQLIQVPLIQVPLLRLDDAAIARQPHTPLPHALHPAQLAYVMYTSGSTGRPKGVMVPHRQILNWLHALWARAPFEAGERVAQKTSIAFAISVKELLAGLLAGVPQVFIDEDTVRDIPAFVRALETWQITRLYTFPSQLNALLDHVAETPQRLARLRQLFVSIEPCPAELLQRLRTLLPACTAWYIYGCTEINDMTYCDPAEQHSGSGFVPVGRPIANTKVHVLDEQLRPLPPGIMGEVHIESLGIAHGYWRQGGLTAARFIANPYGPPGSRLYRTGDMARLLDNGTLELLGRRDYEVKVRGYRVDLRQVEKALAAHLQVAEAAVIGWPQGSPTPELLAYVVPRQGVLNLDELRKLLQERLPTYMLPTRFQSLPALPRLPNGKLDTLSLPEPQAASGDSDYLAPRSEVEITLAKLWSELLTPAQAAPLRVSLNDNFFNLGGHSLLATQLFSRIRQSFDIEVRVNTLFESPVLEDFAAVVERGMRQSQAGSMPVSLIVPLSLRTERAAMYAIHPIGGQIHCYIDLAAALGHSARVYGLQCEPVRRFAHLSDLAAHYCDALLAGPTGVPYRLLGWSSGGVLALAVAEQLQRRGLRVDYVGLLDSSLIPVHAREPRQLTFVAALNTLAALAKRGFEQAEIDEARQLLFADGDDEHVFDYSRHQASLDKLLAHLRFTLESRMWPPLAEQLRVTRYHLGLLAGFEPQCLQPNAHLYQAQTAVHVSYADMSKPRGGSEVLPDITGYVPLSQIKSAAGNHYSMLQGDPLRELARMLVTDLDA